MLWHPICYIVDILIEDYDKSTELVYSNQYLKHAIRWDSLFFLEIIQNGYRFLKNHAFGSAMIPLASIFNQSIFSLLILQKICNAISTYLIYKITLYYTNNNKQYSRIVSILFIFNPASVFFNSLYTESFFTILIMSAIYLQINQHIYISSILFAISIHFRSNGMFYIIYSGYPYLYRAFICIKDKKINQLLQTILQAIPIGLIYIISIIIMLYLPYKNFCNQETDMEWCKSFIPYAYGYIQKQFWDVSFLSSYKLRKSFFIFWGVQGLIVQGYWIYLYFKRKATIQIKQESIALILPTIILFLISAFLAHINCSSRFFSTQITFYWALADLLKINKKAIMFYLIEFNLGGIILFSNYLLWA